MYQNWKKNSIFISYYDIGLGTCDLFVNQIFLKWYLQTFLLKHYL